MKQGLNSINSPTHASILSGKQAKPNLSTCQSDCVTIQFFGIFLRESSTLGLKLRINREKTSIICVVLLFSLHFAYRTLIVTQSESGFGMSLDVTSCQRCLLRTRKDGKPTRRSGKELLLFQSVPTFPVWRLIHYQFLPTLQE